MLNKINDREGNPVKDESVKAISECMKKRENENTTLWSRKDFLSLAGWGGVLVSIGSSLLAFGRFMFPRVLFEPSPVFKAGYPDEYPVGKVNLRFMQDQRVWIVREKDGIYALLAICTHLGCTPNWLEGEEKFKCPCHGSGFKKDGINFEGPAPRALERVKITVAADGQLLIDKSKKFVYEKGEWGQPASIVRV